MFQTGIDSMALKKEFVPLDKYLSEKANELVTKEKPIVLKALVGASVTTEDQKFDGHYQTILSNAFEKHEIHQEKIIYKGAQLLKKISAKFDDVITDILNDIEQYISHIDLYFATYPKPYISIYGKAQGQRLPPLEFIEKHKNGFPQACTWWHWKKYSETEKEHEYLIDYFDSKITPAWTELEENKVNMQVFYSGSQCNSLISFADLLLKTIELFHFGIIDYRSIGQPLWKRSKTYALSQKIHSYNLSKYDWVIRATVPDSPLIINLNGYVKHPIYFIAWTPTLPRTTVKKSFEWSKLYNAIMKKAIDTSGCVKFLDFDKDATFWDSNDVIIPWEAQDEEHIRLLTSMGFDKFPKILKASELIT